MGIKMTRQLEELLNLPETNIIEEKEDRGKNDAIHSMQSIIKDSSVKPDAKPKDFNTTSDIELDDIATDAKKTYDELMELGMNVDSRYSARIFEVASTFLKISLDAKSTKVNKVLKTMELKHKQETQSSNYFNNTTIGADHVVSDRNSLLEKLRNIS